MGAVSSALRKAAAEYCSCPEGHVRVTADLHHAEARQREVLASTLRHALEDARREGERQRDLAAALSRGRQDLESGPGQP